MSKNDDKSFPISAKLSSLIGPSCVANGGAAKTFTYNATGSITSKTGLGDYAYPPSGTLSVRPHAVSSISVSGTVVASYTYDANGNMLSGDGRTVTYAAFNLPETITRGGSTLSFAYDSEHSRIRQAGPGETTVYLSAFGVRAERLTYVGSGATRWNNYIFAGGEMIALRVEDSVAGIFKRYYHKDHLGSVHTITDQAGAVVERDGFDPWGKRRFPSGADDPGETITSETSRGFTGHEHLEEPMTSNQLSRVFLGMPFQGERFTNFVGIDVKNLPVVPGRPHVFVIPNKGPLNVRDRIVSWEEVDVVYKGRVETCAP